MNLRHRLYILIPFSFAVIGILQAVYNYCQTSLLDLERVPKLSISGDLGSIDIDQPLLDDSELDVYLDQGSAMFRRALPSSIPLEILPRMHLYEKIYSDIFPRTEIVMHRVEQFSEILFNVSIDPEQVYCSAHTLERPFGELWDDPKKVWQHHTPDPIVHGLIADLPRIKLDVDGYYAPQYGRLSAMVVTCTRGLQRINEIDGPSVIYQEVFHHFEAALQSSSKRDVHPSSTTLDGIQAVQSQSWRNPWRPPMRWEQRSSTAMPYSLGTDDLFDLMSKKDWVPMDPKYTDQWPILLMNVQGGVPLDQFDDWIVAHEVESIGYDTFNDISMALMNEAMQQDSDRCSDESFESPTILNADGTLNPSDEASLIDSHIGGTSLPYLAMSGGYWTGYLAELHASVPHISTGRRYTWDVNGPELNAARMRFGSIETSSHGPSTELLISDLADVLHDFRGWPGFLVLGLMSNTFLTVLDEKHRIKIDLDNEWTQIAIITDQDTGRLSYAIRLSNELNERYPNMIEQIRSNVALMGHHKLSLNSLDIHGIVKTIIQREWPTYDAEYKRDELVHGLNHAQHYTVESMPHELPKLPPPFYGDIETEPWPVLSYANQHPDNTDVKVDRFPGIPYIDQLLNEYPYSFEPVDLCFYHGHSSMGMKVISGQKVFTQQVQSVSMLRHHYLSQFYYNNASMQDAMDSSMILASVDAWLSENGYRWTDANHTKVKNTAPLTPNRFGRVGLHIELECRGDDAVHNGWYVELRANRHAQSKQTWKVVNYHTFGSAKCLEQI